MRETDIQNFWQNHPCGELLVGGLDHRRGDYISFFDEYDRFRYATEDHILRCLDAIDFDGKRTLEIGLGQGADSEQIIRRGATWSGLDVTEESVARVRARLELRALHFDALKKGSVLEIPFPDHSFDIVFSHGVLHHVPDIQQAQREIHRVLKPDGELIVMLYAKWSLNYLLCISFLRRLGLFALYFLNLDLGNVYGQHVSNAKDVGLWQYIKLANFVHKNTDGPFNPYSKVYDLRTVKKDFPSFQIARAHKEFMHAPPLRVRILPLHRLLGWHLWVHLKPVLR